MNYYLHSSTLVISLDMVVLYSVIIMNHLLIFHYYRYNRVKRKTRIYRLSLSILPRSNQTIAVLVLGIKLLLHWY